MKGVRHENTQNFHHHRKRHKPHPAHHNRQITVHAGIQQTGKNT